VIGYNAAKTLCK